MFFKAYWCGKWAKLYFQFWSADKHGSHASYLSRIQFYYNFYDQQMLSIFVIATPFRRVLCNE